MWSHHNVLPGDLVALNSSDPACAVTLVTESSFQPKEMPFINQDAAKHLQKVYIERQFVMSGSVYLVICTSKSRAMLLHQSGKLLVAEQRFLLRKSS